MPVNLWRASWAFYIMRIPFSGPGAMVTLKVLAWLGAHFDFAAQGLGQPLADELAEILHHPLALLRAEDYIIPS